MDAAKQLNVQKNTAHSVEEKLNSVTHSIGAGLSIAGLVFLLVLTRLNNGTPLQYVSFSLYGAFQILLYLSSAFTHQFADRPKVFEPLRVLDQAAIYLLIAGTYTPVALLGLQGRTGWIIFGAVWAMAAAGIIFKVFVFKEKHLASDFFYLPMGWLIITAVKPLVETMPRGFLIWALIGGLAYSIGIIFYMVRKIPFNHVIWHLFVLAGSISFYLSFAFYLV